MATFWKLFFTDQASKVIDSVGKIIDDLITTKEEREKLKNELDKETQKHHVEMAKQITNLEVQITQHHQIDMASDSWLSKNIRPLCLIYILFLFTFLSLGPLEPEESVMEAIKGFVIVVMSFYFGGRSFEKITSIVKKK